MVVTGHAGIFAGDANEEARIIAEDIWNAPLSLLSKVDASNILTQVNVYRNVGGPPFFVGQWNGSLAGGAGGTGQAIPNVSVLVQKQTGLAGRRNRGRMYVPGIQAGGIGDDGVIDATQLTSWQAAADVWFDAADAILPLVILHETPPDTATPVLSLSVQALVATQRRRLR
ncbi:MAG: hypothetical protein GEU78_18625 [Actinobacteria bacterium]|nr:hypothetical protein [Actinomycetota bacterium]